MKRLPLQHADRVAASTRADKKLNTVAESKVPEGGELTLAPLRNQQCRSSHDNRCHIFLDRFQQLARPRAEPERQFVLFGLVTTGDPLILGTCGREAAFGLLGLTAPGIPGWFAAGLPVVPGGLVWATAEVATARPSPTDNIARGSVFHICRLQWE